LRASQREGNAKSFIICPASFKTFKARSDLVTIVKKRHGSQRCASRRREVFHTRSTVEMDRSRRKNKEADTCESFLIHYQAARGIFVHLNEMPVRRPRVALRIAICAIKDAVPALCDIDDTCVRTSPALDTVGKIMDNSTFSFYGNCFEHNAKLWCNIST